MHTRGRSRDTSGRAGTRRPQAAARDRRGAVPDPPAASCGEPRSARCGPLCGPPRGDDRVADRECALRGPHRLQPRRPRAGRHAWRHPARTGAPARALPGPLRRHLSARRLRSGLPRLAHERAAGIDGRAAQRRVLGHLERSLRARPCGRLRQALTDGRDELDRLRPWRPRGRRARACCRVRERARGPVRRAGAARGGCGYPATERFYEIGSPAALEETEAFLAGALPPSPHRRDSP